MPVLITPREAPGTLARSPIVVSGGITTIWIAPGG
jgi:hypothetical protein